MAMQVTARSLEGREEELKSLIEGVEGESNGLRYRGNAAYGNRYGRRAKIGIRQCDGKDLPSVGDAISLRSWIVIPMAPSVALLLAMGSFLMTGVLCLLFAPLSTNTVGDFVVPETSRCLRSYRTADYLSVFVNVGTPLAMMQLLVRFDRVLDPETSGTTHVRLFSTRIAESVTVSCVESECMDVAVVQLGGPRSSGSRVVLDFAYTNPVMEEISESTASLLGLDGEMYLGKGVDYYATASHFCFDSVEDESLQIPEGAAVQGNVVSEEIVVDAAKLSGKASHFSDTPVFVAEKEQHCQNDTLMASVVMYPHRAGLEFLWLGLGSNRMYEYGGTGIHERREVVEVGSHCAGTFAGYERAFSLFKLDCLAYNVPCETHPTMPFRRIARSEFRLLVQRSGLVHQWIYDDPRLHNMPKFSESFDAVWMALLKLLMMLLTAGIVWIRSAKATSSSDWLYVHSVRAAFDMLPKQVRHRSGAKDHDSDADSEDDVEEHTDAAFGSEIENIQFGWEDAFIGFVAIAARHGVAQWRMLYFELDGQTRVCWMEIAASIVSLMHWFLRYFGLERDHESAITKLGGSTAIIDASCAVMLAFSEAPLMVTSMGRFDPTARLLVALLIALTAVQRCLFAAAGCAVRWAAVYDEPGCSFLYKTVAFTAVFQWIFQASSLGLLMADIFVTPGTYSLCRAWVGDFSPISHALFMTMAVVGMPQLVHISKRVSDAKL